MASLIDTGGSGRSSTPIRNVGSKKSTKRKSSPTPRASAPRQYSAPSGRISPPVVSSSPPASPRPVSRKAPPAPKPKPIPSIGTFLAGDDIYQQSLRGGERTLRDFLSDTGRRRGESGVQFEQTQEQLGLDRDRQLEEMKNEFASRGLIHSGLFAEERGDFLQDFTAQQTQFQQAYEQLLADILAEETGFRRQNELAQELSKQQALQRRVQQYNIGV